MKTITVDVSEPVYREFQDYARRVDRKTSELIREAMEEYRTAHISRGTSLRERRPTSVGGPIAPITEEDDILGEMLASASAADDSSTRSSPPPFAPPDQPPDHQQQEGLPDLWRF